MTQFKLVKYLFCCTALHDFGKMIKVCACISITRKVFRIPLGFKTRMFQW